MPVRPEGDAHVMSARPVEVEWTAVERAARQGPDERSSAAGTPTKRDADRDPA